MGEDKMKIKDAVYPILLEELVGKEGWEGFLGKVQDGKLEDAAEMAKYLKKAAIKRYGALLAEERLDSHDEKIIAKIEQLLGVEKEYGKEKAAHKETKGLLRRLQSHVNFLEIDIILKVAEAVNYTAEPVFVADKRQTLQHDYINGLLEYIKANGTAGAATSGAAAQLGESNKLLLAKEKENKELSERVAALAGENVALKSEHDEIKAKYEKLLAEKEELGLKFQKYYDIVEAFKSDIKPEIEKAEQNNTEE